MPVRGPDHTFRPRFRNLRPRRTGAGPESRITRRAAGCSREPIVDFRSLGSRVRCNTPRNGEVAMRGRNQSPTKPTKFAVEFWDQIRAGRDIEEAARALGASITTCRNWFRHRGGVKPPHSYGRSRRYLTFDEREDIAMSRVQGLGVRDIARRLNRDPGTISRELRRAPRNPQDVRPSRPSYLASVCQSDADRKRTRHRPGKLATNLALRREVQARLKLKHSPE